MKAEARLYTPGQALRAKLTLAPETPEEQATLQVLARHVGAKRRDGLVFELVWRWPDQKVEHARRLVERAGPAAGADAAPESAAVAGAGAADGR